MVRWWPHYSIHQSDLIIYIKDYANRHNFKKIIWFSQIVLWLHQLSIRRKVARNFQDNCKIPRSSKLPLYILSTSYDESLKTFINIAKHALGYSNSWPSKMVKSTSSLSSDGSSSANRPKTNTCLSAFFGKPRIPFGALDFCDIWKSQNRQANHIEFQELYTLI